jgi:hypothetical protein
LRVEDDGKTPIQERAGSDQDARSQPARHQSVFAERASRSHHGASATLEGGKLTTTDLLEYRNKDFIVILSVGRSGSTLLQGVLNAIPGFLIRGENHSLMLHACRAYRGLQQMKRDRAPTTPQSPWYGAEAVNPDEYLEDTARAILRQILADKRDESFEAIGFKEIRWLPADLSRTNLWNYLRFIEEVFPKATFILLTRKVEKTLGSGWWTTFDPADAAADIESFYLLARSAPVRRLFEIGFEQLVPGSDALHSLLRFLGREYNAEIDETLRKPHSFRPAAGSPGELQRSYEYISELEAFRDAQADELTRLRGELRTATGELHRSGTYISELVAFRDHQANQLDRARRELGAALSELERSGSYIAELTAFRDQQAHELERLRRELHTAVSELQRSGSYIAELTAFRDLQARELERLRGEHQAATTEISRAASYIAELVAFRDEQAAELGRLRHELQSMTTELSRSASYVSEVEAFRDILRDELSRLRSELETAQTERARSGNYIHELVRFRDSQGVELDRLRGGAGQIDKSEDATTRPDQGGKPQLNQG